MNAKFEIKVHKFSNLFSFVLHVFFLICVHVRALLGANHLIFAGGGVGDGLPYNQTFILASSLNLYFLPPAQKHFNILLKKTILWNLWN